MQLILETSGSLPYVVLQENGTILHAWSGSADQHHSQSLLAGIDECLRASGRTLSQLESVAVGVGPGMFTGLRIGVATAKFLADLHGVPTVPFSSLLAIALAAPAAERVWAMNDARSKRVYALLLEGAADPLRPNATTEEQAFTPAEAAARMRAGDLLIGEGALVYRSEWPAFVKLATQAEPYFEPQALARLGQALFLAKRTVPALELEPRYLKTGQAHLP